MQHERNYDLRMGMRISSSSYGIVESLISLCCNFSRWFSPRCLKRQLNYNWKDEKRTRRFLHYLDCITSRLIVQHCESWSTCKLVPCNTSSYPFPRYWCRDTHQRRVFAPSIGYIVRRFIRLVQSFEYSVKRIEVLS